MLITFLLYLSACVGAAPDPMANLPLTILNSLLSPQSFSDACRAKGLNMLNNFTKDNGLVTLLMLSGKGIGELGDYKGCKEKSGSHFVVLDILSLPVTLAIGLCLPKECGPEDFSSFRATIADAVNSAFSSNGSSPLGKKLTANDVQFVDSEERAKEKSYTLPFFLVLGVVALFILVNIAAYVFRPASPTEGGLLAFFDPAKNFPQLFGSGPEARNPDLQIFSGIRFFCMAWVIVGHTYYYVRYYPVTNPNDILGFMKKFWNSYLTNATYSVDTFFFMSAFVAFYLVMHEVQKQSGWVNPLRIYLHRLLRLSPLYFLAVASYTWVLSHTVEGPMAYKLEDELDESCRKYWYANFLYFENFVEPGKQCSGWLWYLGNDMQFFLLIPIIAMIHYRSKAVSLLILAVTCIGCMLMSTWVAVHYNLSASYMKFTSDYFKYFYYKPYSRIPPYLLGIVASMMYMDYKQESAGWMRSFTLTMGRLRSLRWTVYFLAVNVMFWLVHTMYWLCKYPDDWTRNQDVSYLVLNKALFLVAFFFFIYPAMTGHGSFVRKFLGHPFFRPFGRIAYAAYMYHPIMLAYHTFREVKGDYFDDSKCTQRFFGYLVLACGLSYVLTPLIESPIRRISSKLLHPWTYPKYQAAWKEDNEKESIDQPTEGPRDSEDAVKLLNTEAPQ